MSEPIKTYDGDELDVTWDKRLCIHVGECGRSDDEMFVAKRDPWCQPNLVSAEQAVDVVERCPTGALVYLRKKDDGPEETADGVNRVYVSNHGPLYVRGDLNIEGAPEDMAGVRFRAALCRCGESKNKPFCDNSHEGSGFKDRGAIGRTGKGYDEGETGALTVSALKDGPLKVSGPHVLVSPSGRETYRGKTSFLCRCGQSASKPFCDGAHSKAGFKG